MENTAKITTAWPAQEAKYVARIAELETLVRFYEEQFKLQKQRQFGASSEKNIIDEQLGFFDEAECTADPKYTEPTLEQITYTRRKRQGKRDDDLSALPVEVVEHELPAEAQICPDCGESLHVMGHEKHRRLKIIPAQVVVIEDRRAVYSCRRCEKTNEPGALDANAPPPVPIIKAPMPEPVIKGSLASPSSVAHVMTQKYVMHVPLYRQEQDWKRQGVYLSRQTLANWVIRCADDWLTSLYERMKALLLDSWVLHADETVLQVLKEPGKRPQTNSYMWLYRTSGDTKRHIILFEYQPSRAREHPKRFLERYKGYLHTDGYAPYHSLLGLTVVGCWVHMRRKFEDALKVIPPEERPTSKAQEAIRRIGMMFHMEDTWENLPPEERYEKRLQESKPLAEVFFTWLNTLGVLPKSAMGKAVHYALEQRPWLMNVYLDGRTELSNNRAENAIRPFALGRKNWLFSNSVNGAKASAVVYSIIETAKANGLKPFEYLEFLFETLPNTTIGKIDELLPWGMLVPERCRMPVFASKGVHDA
jgi:transposase